MELEYDVVIVGAGPAGLFAAKAAREGGASVLLVEEHAAIGSPVQCAEGVHPSTLAEFGFSTGESWVNARITGARVHSPSGKEASLNATTRMDGTIICIIERKLFEKYAAVKLANMGVCVMAKTRALGLVKDRERVVGVRLDSMGQELDVRCKVVIGADGPVSRVAGWAGIKVYRGVEQFDSGAQLQMAGVRTKSSELEVFFGDFAPKGYTWIFPKGEGFANVGITMAAGSPDEALASLRGWVETEPRLRGGSVVEVNAGPIPIAGPVPDLVEEGVMIVGDAARMVNPFSGGGISFATDAGLMAGGVAAQAAREGDASKARLSEFERAFHKKYDKQFRRFYAIKRALYELEPAEVDDFIAAIGEIEIPEKCDTLDKVRRHMLGRLFKVVVKKARLLLKLRKLMKRHGVEFDEGMEGD